MRLSRARPTPSYSAPGCTNRTATRSSWQGLLVRQGPPMVVDGGGLNLLSCAGEWWRDVKRPLVLTPHPGRVLSADGVAAAMTGRRSAERAALEAAARFDAVVVPQGRAHRGRGARRLGRRRVVRQRGLCHGGHGATVARRNDRRAARHRVSLRSTRPRLGVYLHGRAGELGQSARSATRDCLRSDLTSALPVARRELGRSVGQQRRSAFSADDDRRAPGRRRPAAADAARLARDRSRCADQQPGRHPRPLPVPDVEIKRRGQGRRLRPRPGASGTALRRIRVQRLCVASFDEATRRRGAGIETPILVMFSIPVDAVARAAPIAHRDRRLGRRHDRCDTRALARLHNDADDCACRPTSRWRRACRVPASSRTRSPTWRG